MPIQIAQTPEIVALQKTKLIPAYLALIQAYPENAKTIPDQMFQNPDFVTAYKNYVVKFLRSLPARSINDYPSLLVPAIANDPAVQKELARGVVAGSWYAMFKQARKTVAQEIEYQNETTADADDRTNTYFSIGHGDDEDGGDYENGNFNAYYVWRYIDNSIEAFLVKTPEMEKTHGSLWGHNNSGFKGRYEIGRKYLTLVRDSELNRKRAVPEFILTLLKRQFPKVEKIFVF